MTKPLTVLLWSQDEDHEELLAYNLVKEGFIVSSVSSEEEIVPQALAIHPDIILMGDCSSDELSISIIKAIKKNHREAPPRFVCLTTKGVPNDVNPVCQTTDACLALPVKPKDIISLLMSLVQESGAETKC